MKKNSSIPADKWSLLSSGDEEGLYRCFEVCYNDLYRLGLYLYKDVELVKDSIQLLFIELWKQRDKLPSVTNIKEYSLTIFRRILYKQYIAAKKHRSSVSLSDHKGPGPSVDSYEDMLIQHQESEQLRIKLQAVLPQLSERQRELIWMRYFEEKDIDEIVRITALTARTVYNTLHNALTKLKMLLGNS